GQALDIADRVSINLRLHLFTKIFLTPRQVSRDMADDQEFGVRLLGDADSLGNSFAGRHTTNDHQEIFRLVIKSNLVQIYSVIDDRDRWVTQTFRLSVADTYRKTMREMCPIVFMELPFHIRIGNQGRRGRRSGKIGCQSCPVGMNHIEALGLPVKVVGVPRFIFLFQVKSGMGIILAGNRQDRMERALDLGVPRSEKLHVMAAPVELLAEIVNDPLRSSMRLRRDRNINTRDLGDLHGRGLLLFYTRWNAQQEHFLALTLLTMVT